MNSDQKAALKKARAELNKAYGLLRPESRLKFDTGKLVTLIDDMIDGAVPVDIPLLLSKIHTGLSQIYASESARTV